MPTCALPECDNELPKGRKRFCSEPHARRNRQRGAPEQGAAEVETADLRAALRRTQTALVRAKAKTEDLVDAVYTAARDAAIAQPLPTVKLQTVPKAGKGLSEVALLHTTDWQLGKQTESYNTQKCVERVALLVEKVRLLTAIQRTEHPVSKIAVALGGDMLEGLNIFPGQAYEVDSTLFEMLFATSNLLVWLMMELLAYFEEVVVIGEEGNHGRLGRKGDWPRTDNTDMMAYQIAKDRLAGEKRLTWLPRLTWHQKIEIGAYKAMLIHGDEIKSFGGNTPAFGLLRKGTAWASGVVGDFRDIYFGHYHTPMELTLPNGGTMFGTGSTESDNVYAQEFVAAKGLPSQRLHFIDPRKGRVTAQYKVYLDDDE